MDLAAQEYRPYGIKLEAIIIHKKATFINAHTTQSWYMLLMEVIIKR